MSDERSANAVTARPNFRRAMEAYSRGENVTKHLQREMQTDGNTPAIIEMAYDLQAGTYIDWVKQNADLAARRTAEAAEVLDPHLLDGDTLLDVGTGELTTFSALAARLKARLGALYAFDISWSRVHCGLGFAAQTMPPELFSKLSAFVADIGATPFRTKSIDVTISNHALEPNGGHEKEILSELLRITRRKLVLFEPSYADNSEQGRQRMERLGYVKDLDRHARELGATVEDVRPLRNIDNPENPTFAYVIVPVDAKDRPAGTPAAFADPGTDNPLVKFDSCYFSPERGVAYPVIEGIPVLRAEAAVLTSALSKKC